MAIRRRTGLLGGLLHRFLIPITLAALAVVALVWALHQMGVWDKTVSLVRELVGIEAAEKTDEIGEKINETGEEVVDDPRSTIERILAGDWPFPLPGGGGAGPDQTDATGPYLPTTLPVTVPGEDSTIDWAVVQNQLDQLGITDTAAGQRIEPYDRDKHFGGWVDNNNDGCRDDEEVRLRDSVEVTLEAGSTCVAQTGILHDPYSGKIIPFDRAVQPLAVEVEHIVSLHDVYYSGGWQMSYEQRVAIAHDLERELVLTSRVENQAKKEKTPAEWMPSDPSSWCWYAATYIDVKATYHLTVDLENKTFLRDVIAACSG